MYLELWFKALRSQVGIVVKTDDVERLRQRLYAARANYENPAELAELTLIPSPTTPGDLWIVHKRIKPDAQEG